MGWLVSSFSRKAPSLLGDIYLVWCPKYRKRILVEEVRGRVKELFFEIAERFDFEIDRCEVGENHVHVLISFPPRYSIAQVVGIIRGKSGSKIFEEYPKLKKKLWGGHLWEQGILHVPLVSR